MLNNQILLVARVLLSFMFLMSGLSKFGDIAGTAGYITSVGLPAGTALAWLAAIFESLAGLALLIGFQTRYVSWLLAGFCVFTAFVFHGNVSDQMQMIMMMKNLTIAGGLLAFSVAGPGMLAVDNRLRTAAA